jgi:hypothetical protein
MPHIFISYSRQDSRIAKGLADLLTSEGFDVWWDPKIRIGKEFPDEIEQAILDCQHVIVLWSSRSVESEWVIREASLAKRQNKLLPIKLDDCEIPFGFKTIHTVPFRGWAPLLEELYGVVGGGGFSLVSAAVHAPVANLPSLAPPMAMPPPQDRRVSPATMAWLLVLLTLLVVGVVAYLLH